MIEIFRLILQHHLIVSLTKTSFKNTANDVSKMVHMVNDFFFFFFFFVKTLKILCSLGHLILFKFQQLMVKHLIKKLQIVFKISNVNTSNGNMEKFQRKI